MIGDGALGDGEERVKMKDSTSNEGMQVRLREMYQFVGKRSSVYGEDGT